MPAPRARAGDDNDDDEDDDGGDEDDNDDDSGLRLLRRPGRHHRAGVLPVSGRGAGHQPPLSPADLGVHRRGGDDGDVMI